MNTITIPIPNVINTNVNSVETFYDLIDTMPPAGQYVFDLSRVDFVKPYGAIALVIAARRLSSISGRPIKLKDMADQVHLYLHRMDLFDVGSDWLRPTSKIDEEWARNPQTPNLLELTVITGSQDVTTVITRAERIFSRWLMIPNLYDLLNVISELCTNIYEHSGDNDGCVLIQKYETVAHDQAIIHLAVGDLGCGIRGSLSTRHGQIGQEPLDYLHEAMSGKTARKGRGGLGLRRVEKIAGEQGGHLWLRSETAAILSRGSGKAQGRKNLTNVPGTQVAVEFHAPLLV
jgi:anti-sigma regulatory factor (Ser/Thr protein kinase)